MVPIAADLMFNQAGPLFLKPVIFDVHSCTWRGEVCDMGRMFQPIWTDVGDCYTFNAGEQRLKSTETGQPD